MDYENLFIKWIGWFNVSYSVFVYSKTKKKKKLLSQFDQIIPSLCNKSKMLYKYLTIINTSIGESIDIYNNVI